MILTGLVNGVIFWRRAKAKIADHPEYADKIKKFILGLVIFLSAPWIIMEMGVVLGGVPTFLHLLNPRDLNPYVLASHVMINACIIYGIIWIYLKGGAEFLAKHQDVLLQKTLFAQHYTAASIKLLAIPMIIGGVGGEIFMWVVDFPISDFLN
jgi:hypothetical protein